MHRVAIIGAGVAGISCANLLTEAGCDVHVFDKGRDLGGRLATRTNGKFAFDHGAPWVEAQRLPFQDCLERLLREGSAVRMPFGGNGIAGFPRMNQLLAPLAKRVQLNLSTEVMAIGREGGQWSLELTDARRASGFDALVITAPAPQTNQLAGQFAARWSEHLRIVRYEPCLTMMAAYREAVGVDLPVSSPPDSFIELQIRNSEKPGRPNSLDSWVVHADVRWSEANLERERDDVARLLHEEFLRANQLNAVDPVYLRGHRWRYSRVVQPVGVSHLWDSDFRLGLAGDWLLGPDAEHAFESGLSLARALLPSVQLPQPHRSGN